jgi:hypothetical protein
MLSFTSFNTFEEVVKHYENTKPIREQGHGTSRNVRPIGDRARKWETIQKISRNCYAISCGNERGNDLFRYWGYNTTTIDANNNYVTTYDDHGAKLEDYAPIVWRKRKDGTVTVTINNMTGIHYSISHYEMIRRHTPKGMAFVHNGSGKQYIRLLNSGTDPDYRYYDTHNKSGDFYLAKNKTIPRAEWAKVKQDGNENHHWHKWKRTTDDNSALTFIQRSIGVWEHDGISGRSLPKGPKVNKALKAKFKPAMDKLFEWGMTMTPLLPLEYEYTTNKTGEMHNYFCEREFMNTWSPWKPKWTREILKDENHPMRLNFWVMFAATTSDGWYLNQTYKIKEVQNKEDLSRIRARYNSFINNNAGFMIEGEQ